MLRLCNTVFRTAIRDIKWWQINRQVLSWDCQIGGHPGARHIKLDGINTQRVELGYWYGSVLAVDENGYDLKSI